MLKKSTSYLAQTLGGVHKLRLQDLSFFDHLPPSVYIFYGIIVYKKSIFLTTYPPPLVNVVCERPLAVIAHHDVEKMVECVLMAFSFYYANKGNIEQYLYRSYT